MATTPLLGILLAVIPGLTLGAVSAPSIPDTPAGHALGQWLDAFNSGDRATLESFDKAHAPWLPLDGQMQLRERTGGYDLLSIDKSDKLWIVFRTKERASSAQTVGRLIVRSYDPDDITLLSLDPAGESSTRIAVDEAQRTRVIDGAVKLLNEFYVFPDVARKVSAKLRTQQKHGAYRNITDAEIFAIRLSDDLVALSGDKHVGVDFFTEVVPDEPPPSHPHTDPRLLAQRNCGFETAEHYPPNIGYLKLTYFDVPEQCAATTNAAMNFLADSDALIIDLRVNHGGAPHMAALISSFLFDEATHLDDLYDRGQNTTEQLWTFPHLPGKKLTGKPIFVLTSARTFSSGELFSYDLKALKRATLIGETTGGGAHTIAPHRIDDHFVIRVPFGRFVNPVTKTDWEGTGVEPDVKVPATEALEVAKKLAAEAISKVALHGSQRSAGAADRDQYRHPVETLAFFGFTPTMTVLDVGPGTGYYTELLAPVLAKDGLYLTTNREPPSSAAAPSGHHWSPYEGERFDELLRAAPELYSKVQVIRVDYETPKLNLDGKVDMVLLMREVHMMKNWGTLDTWLREIHRALKPNGILGVEEHRAAPGANPEETVQKGYLPEAWVIEKIEAAGFALAEKSEINANPKDTKDYPNGVWSLPPSFQAGPDYTSADARVRAKYAPIGGSDRMTLKFVRVADGAAR